jgi:hypothetical protein
MKAKHILKALVIVSILLVPGLGLCQGLTDAQYTTLQNDILVTHQAEFATPVAQADYATIATAYNQTASPVYWLWRTQLPEKEIYETTVEGQSWNWTTYIGQSIQERDGWQTMLRPGQINPSLPQVRGAFDKIFSGAGAAATQRTYLYTVSRRQALRGEALFADTTSGDGSTATPAQLTKIGNLTYYDVYYALTGNRP